MTQEINLSDLDLSLDFHNYDSDAINVEETVNVVFIVDVSPSVRPYIADLNAAFNDFIQTMQSSHIHDRLFVSIVEFDDRVRVRSGFQPIIGIPVTTFVPQGGGTALYEATAEGINNALEYRTNLENSGINVKTLIFIITDGQDNSSKRGMKEGVFNTLNSLKLTEASTFSFTSVLFGVGNDNSFETAKQEMGIDILAKVGQTGAEIRKMISFISSSISKSSSGTNPIDINF